MTKTYQYEPMRLEVMEAATVVATELYEMRAMTVQEIVNRLYESGTSFDIKQKNDPIHEHFMKLTGGEYSPLLYVESDYTHRISETQFLRLGYSKTYDLHVKPIEIPMPMNLVLVLELWNGEMLGNFVDDAVAKEMGIAYKHIEDEDDQAIIDYYEERISA